MSANENTPHPAAAAIAFGRARASAWLDEPTDVDLGYDGRSPVEQLDITDGEYPWMGDRWGGDELIGGIFNLVDLAVDTDLLVFPKGVVDDVALVRLMDQNMVVAGFHIVVSLSNGLRLASGDDWPLDNGALWPSDFTQNTGRLAALDCLQSYVEVVNGLVARYLAVLAAVDIDRRRRDALAQAWPRRKAQPRYAQLKAAEGAWELRRIFDTAATVAFHPSEDPDGWSVTLWTVRDCDGELLWCERLWGQRHGVPEAVWGSYDALGFEDDQSVVGDPLAAAYIFRPGLFADSEHPDREGLLVLRVAEALAASEGLWPDERPDLKPPRFAGRKPAGGKCERCGQVKKVDPVCGLCRDCERNNDGRVAL